MRNFSSVTYSTKRLWHKWALALKLLPIILIVVVLKFLSHHFGYEIMELNALFTSIVAGTIFLIGFLIAGVLSDYKESEKIPSELTASMRTMFDDTYSLYKGKNSESARAFLAYQKTFIHSLMDWFYRKEDSKSLLKKLSDMNDFTVGLDNEGVQPAYVIKIKNEQHNIRKTILRIDTIRDTDFIGYAYAIVEAMGLVITVGMLFLKIQPFYASVFFTVLVVFLIAYMLVLIKDLDDPFDYSGKGEGGSEISLKQLRDMQEAMEEYTI